MSNKNLSKAKADKYDEFYTQLGDIENECKHYKEHFRGKTILCNCDDPYESNFFKYFAMNFNSFGLKKLIATCYNPSPIAGTQISWFDTPIKNSSRKAYKIEITEVNDETGDGAVGLADVEWLIKNKKNVLTWLEDNGDFRSEECVELLKEADIVITNPPFSLFRQYIDQLIRFDKKFLIIGNQNAITYKEVFPLIKNGKVWLGFSSGGQTFEVPMDFDRNNTYIENGKKYAKFGNICWFTNLDYKERHEELTLVETYTPEKYPKYDNYDAINIDKVVEIPKDYDGVMGVPITFLDKYNPEQFEIVGFGGGWNGKSPLVTRKYPIQQYQTDSKGETIIVGKLNDGTPAIQLSKAPSNATYYTVGDGFFYVRTYGRILIRRK